MTLLYRTHCGIDKNGKRLLWSVYIDMWTAYQLFAHNAPVRSRVCLFNVFLVIHLWVIAKVLYCENHSLEFKEQHSLIRQYGFTILLASCMVSYVFVAFVEIMVSMVAELSPSFCFFISSILKYIFASLIIKPNTSFVLESLCTFMAFKQWGTILMLSAFLI